MEDLNATIGTDRIGNESVLGPHSSGVRNDNGERLLDLCSLHNIKISGSWFRRRNIHRWTWYSNDGRTKKELDYVIVSARWKLVQNRRVSRSADIGNNADHRLVAVSCNIHFRRATPPQLVSAPVNIEKLHDPASSLQFQIALTNRFGILSNLT